MILLSILPIKPQLLGIPINLHLILEYLAFFIGYRYYRFLRNQQTDHITNSSRLSIILGAAIGAFVGSRLFGFLENPVIPDPITSKVIMTLFNTKTIMGGLFGGLLGVELSKKIIGESQSSGDLFTLPIIVGLFIGRIGCFLSGTDEFTYGKETAFFLGMNLGDGITRHPVALYELFFLIPLFLLLKSLLASRKFENGTVFKLFMIIYFSFRFCIEYLKPNIFYTFGLSSIQWLCILCVVYYTRFILKSIKIASQKIHLL